MQYAVCSMRRDPLEARAAAKTAERVIRTFGECADEFVAAKQSE
jgi:hypothetical protein